MLPLVLAMLTALHPQAPHVGDAKTVADAIAYVASHDDPIPGLSRESTAAVMVVTAWGESRFRMRSVGDQGRAFCAMQVHGESWLTLNPIGCMRSALHLMRLSALSCKDAPLAPYAGGCNSRSARWISAHRLKEAERIEAEARRALAAIASAAPPAAP